MNLWEWAFGGVGGTVVAAIIGVLWTRSMRSTTQTQRVVGDNNMSIQAGRDVHMGPTRQDREHEVQPIMHLRLLSGEGGTSGHYLNGILKNVGRGIARNPKITGPCLDRVNLDGLMKPMEELKLRVRYDNTPAFLTLLEDPTVRVQYENEFGTRFEQVGTVQQARGPHSEVYQYAITVLGPVTRL